MFVLRDGRAEFRPITIGVAGDRYFEVVDGLKVGDQVINLQVPGLFTVIDRRGDLLVIQTPRGLRMTVLDSQVRRLDDVPSGSPTDG